MSKITTTNIDFSLADAVKREDFFNALSPSDLQLVLQNATQKNYKKGDVLIREGEPQTQMFIIESGLIVKEKKDGQKSHLKKGDVTGLLHFFQKDPSAATLTVAEDAVVWVFDSETFRKLLKSSESLNSSYISFLSRQVRKLTKVLSQVRAQLSMSEGVVVGFFDTRDYMKQAFEKCNKDKGFNFHFRWFKEKLNKNTVSLASGCHAVCCFVNDDVGADVLHALYEMNIEMVAMRCAGYDNVDLQTVKKLGMSVTRVPAYSPYAVAEFAVGLMLTLNRKIHKAYNRVREQNFSLNNLVGFDMRGKTVGIIGTGKIGKCTCEILFGFGCKILAYDVIEDSELAQKKNFKYVSKDELFQNSDIISLHAPLLPSTRHLLNKDAFTKMKQGVMIINTSRGPLIDTEALLDALVSGKVAAAGLDVYEGEKDYFFENRSTQNIKDSVLSQLISSPNVLVTGHQAFLTQEALSNIAESTLQSIKDFVGGKKREALTNYIKE
jgi:D-lactate dehydrogenase